MDGEFVVAVRAGGQIPAAVISGTVAASLTAIGKAWIEVCERMLERDVSGSPLDVNLMQQIFEPSSKRFRMTASPSF